MKGLFLFFALCIVIPPPVQAQSWPPQSVPPSNNSPAPSNNYAVSAAPVDFQLIGAQATINRREYVLSQEVSPMIYPLGDHFYRLEFDMERNSSSSLRGNENIHIHFFYDGLRLTFFPDRDGDERPSRYEMRRRQEHFVRHKQELIVEGNRRFMRSAELLVELENKQISTPTNVYDLKLHFIFR